MSVPYLNVLRAWLRARNFRALLLPTEHGFADARHCLLRDLPRLLRAFVEYAQDILRMLLVFLPLCPNGCNPFDQVVRHRRLAFDAANSRFPPPLIRPFKSFLWPEKIVPIVDGTNVRVPPVLPPLPPR